MVLFAVLDGDEQEIIKVSDVIGDKDGIIREEYTRNRVDSMPKSDYKLGVLGRDCLLIVVNFIFVRRGDSALLKTSEVIDRTHHDLVILAISLPRGDPLIDVE